MNKTNVYLVLWSKYEICSLKYQALPNSASMFILQKTYFQLHHNFDILFTNRYRQIHWMWSYASFPHYPILHTSIFNVKKMEHSLYFERRWILTMIHLNICFLYLLKVVQGVADNVLVGIRQSKVVVQVLRDDASALEMQKFLQEVAVYR